ncbi:TonB-dependent receptor [Rhizosphaericola mali]|uniref:TonB-dependent receptor n=1 Tax=Rhizosphaericola mali TaxID=2545455 RepID=A0A5P2G8R8_9BACT|nr:TonB-dependent receptor plug domain-containing protein [Rhizosphaericola mali]QES87921.1 TonB-dependent receptor [Rhizosphaericola mali]
MKQKIIGTLALIFSMVICSHAQIQLSGKVSDTSQNLAGATVTISGLTIKNNQQNTNDSGIYRFSHLPENTDVKIKVSSVGKISVEKIVHISTQNIVLDFTLNDNKYLLEPLEVKAIRASDKAPFTKTNLNAADIAKVNYGRDLPFALNQTPSVVVTSDAGNGIGYTSISIRGSDPSRTNITINGIPYNDAESQGSYFVDIPDVLSSTNSIQIQRGVGTSTNGSGAFGATINLSTNEIREKAYGEINNSFGSFNSWKNTVAAGSGLLNNHFYVDMRLSNIKSDGYIDRAKSNLQSMMLSTGYVSEKTSIRFNFITGKERTYQAWNGVPEDSILAGNRRYNSVGYMGLDKNGNPMYYKNQNDYYTQTHYQLFFNHKFSNNLNLNIATFLTRGKGYYEEYKQDASYADYSLPNYVPVVGDTIKNTDLIRQRYLDNYFYGQTFSLQYNKKNEDVTFGGSWTKYDGKHYGNIIWSQNGNIPYDDQYYNYPAWKSDQNVYLKWLHRMNSFWNLFADVQYRHVKYNMEGFEDTPENTPLDTIKRTFNFLNPKAGVSFTKNGYNAYFSYALANKEPNRSDFEANLDNQPTKETLNDFELGTTKTDKKYSWGVTFYYMLYKNQLVQTGALNDVGSTVRVNVPNSYRAGVELQGSYQISNWINTTANLTLSKNKIKKFTGYYVAYDADWNQIGTTSQEYHNKDISFSPSIVSAGSINILPVKNVELSFISKYVGKQYLDNTQDDTRAISSYYNQDIRLIYTIHNFIFKEWTINGMVINVFNRKYNSNGAAYPSVYNGTLSNDNYYFPMAGTNYMAAINIKL